MSAGRRIKISSFFDIQSQSHHEKITDNNTGKTKEVNRQEPHHSSKKITVIAKPVKNETKSDKDESGEQAVTQGPRVEGYDSSQL
jgi:hypothetical protein